MAKHGFTLMELVIVIALIGLVAGGIMGGKKFIHNAKIRSVMSDINTYETAIDSFEDKYNALPGDIYNATSYWGAINTTGGSGRCGAPLTDAGTGTQTCNGSGDGNVTGWGAGDTWSEAWRAWQHLVNAGLIDGSYTGRQGASGPTYGEVSVNMPVSKLMPDAGFVFRQSSGPGFLGNAFRIGRSEGIDGPIMKPQDAYNVDKKIDDGLPLQGKLQTYGNSTRANCSTTDVTTTSVYDIDNTIAAVSGCNLFYVIHNKL